MGLLIIICFLNIDKWIILLLSIINLTWLGERLNVETICPYMMLNKCSTFIKRISYHNFDLTILHKKMSSRFCCKCYHKKSMICNESDSLGDRLLSSWQRTIPPGDCLTPLYKTKGIITSSFHCLI